MRKRSAPGVGVAGAVGVTAGSCEAGAGVDASGAVTAGGAGPAPPQPLPPRIRTTSRAMRRAPTSTMLGSSHEWLDGQSYTPASRAVKECRARYSPPARGLRPALGGGGVGLG